jgi:tRNA-specific 2-thiouridylase
LKSNDVILAGLSGGVDSSVAAALLLEAGHRVIGVTMKIWDEKRDAAGKIPPGASHACFGPGEAAEIEEARHIARVLGIPFHVAEVAEEYHEYVLSYFREEYRRGRTPNPCIMCNQRIKFGYLLQRAREMGIPFTRFATGHYARTLVHPRTGRHCVAKGTDPRKDQSYFLGLLTQNQVALSLFPLGGMQKSRVREEARRLRLPAADKEESQDFIEGGDYSVLFDSPPGPGPILSTDGKILGQHRGIIHYTVGQRKGLGICGPDPLYVKSIDPQKNAIVVAPAGRLAVKGLVTGPMSWMAVEGIDGPTRARVKVRLTQGDAACTISPLPGGRVEAAFDEAQMFVSPGQAAVFYEDGMIMGGGVIEEGVG